MARSRRPGRQADEAETSTFATTHRFLLVLLWAQVPALAALGMARNVSTAEIVFASLLLVVLGLFALIARSRAYATYAVVLGLVTAAVSLVRYLDGSTESYFGFGLVIVAISFYKDWKPLLLGFACIAAYHLVGGFVVTDLTPARTVDPVTWASIHLGSTVLLVLLLMGGWRWARSGGNGAGDQLLVGFEQAPIGMAVLTPSGDFLRSNQALAQILGYEEAHLPGANIRNLVHGDDLDDLGEAWEEMSTSEERIAETWLRCVTSDGHVVWARVRLSLVPWTSRRRATVVLHLEDAHQAHLEQTRLEDLIRGRDEYVATVAEELRGPIRALLELTARAEGDMVEQVEAEVLAIGSVIDDLLVSARYDTVPVSVVPGTVNAEAACLAALARLPGSERITLDMGAMVAWADPALVRRIVTTLAGNALRYGGPNIRLVTTKSGPDTVIQVIDDGPDIPLSERERIFAGDLRSGSPVTRPAAVGLSLTVARHLARQMDGDVIYRRTQEGQNVFELRIPSEPVSAGRQPRSEIELESPAGIAV